MATLPFRAVRTLELVALLVLGLSCGRPSSGAGESPPRASSAPAVRPNACAGGGHRFGESVGANVLPRVVGPLCIDPHATFRSYGDGEKASLGAACEVLEGECAGYVRF